MVFDIIGGENHLTGKIKEWGHGIAYTSKYNSLATFDGNRLTTAVFMAHDRMIRFEIQPSGPGMLRWCLWKRSGREGDISSRHPTIEMALDNYRKYWDENGRKIN